MSDWQPHINAEVNAAIIRLNDALCTWERATGRESVLIIREDGGWSHRSMSGKPGVPEDVSDQTLLDLVKEAAVICRPTEPGTPLRGLDYA